jgi:hypothetical protein
MLAAGRADGSIRDVDAMAHLLLYAVDEAALFIAHATDPAAARGQAGDALGALLAGSSPAEGGASGSTLFDGDRDP